MEDSARTMELFPNGHAKFMTPDALRKLNQLRQDSALWQDSQDRAVDPARQGGAGGRARRGLTIRDFRRSMQDDLGGPGAPVPQPPHRQMQAGEPFDPASTRIVQWQVSRSAIVNWAASNLIDSPILRLRCLFCGAVWHRLIDSPILRLRCLFAVRCGTDLSIFRELADGLHCTV